ncbi:MAG: hypothetical protein LBL64_05850 [Treponema sp.]|jgi:hypothetical protein|nr:hypothetical protein [Treponema sp.]
MKENKSSQYKTRKRAGGILFTLFCLAGAAGGLWLFWTDLNRVLVKKSEQSVGVVTYKRHAVQRRFEDRLIWSQLPKESPVYNGDLVRTADLSDAMIHFISNDSISLQENSLIHILYDEKTSATRVELIDGDINLVSSSGKTVILSEGREFRPNAGGALTIRRENNKTEAQTITGLTEITTVEGAELLRAGSTASGSSEGRLEFAQSLLALSPLPNEEIQAETDPLSVHFSWTGGSFGPNDYIRLEIAADRRFSAIVHSGDIYDLSETDVPLGPGVWWWRVIQAERGSSIPVSETRPGRLSILRPPQRETEKENARLSSPLVLADLSAETPVSGIELPPPLPEAAVPPPAAQALPDQAEPVQSLPPPLLPSASDLYPPEGTHIDGSFLRARARIIFRWNTVAGANAYLCTIRQGDTVYMNLVREPRMVFEQLASLKNGECVWQVEAVQASANGGIRRHGEIAENRFILSVPRPDAPQINNPEIIYER